MGSKNIFWLVVLLFFLSTLSASTITLMGSKSCGWTFIKSLNCENMIYNQIAKKGSFSCVLKTDIGKCYITNRSGEFSYYPNCQLEFLIDNSSGIAVDHVYLDSQKKEKFKDFHFQIQFFSEGEKGIILKLLCGKDAGVTYSTFFKVISAEEFITQKIIKDSYETNKKISFGLLFTAILSLIIALLTLLLEFRRRKIILDEVNPSIFIKLKKILKKDNNKK